MPRRTKDAVQEQLVTARHNQILDAAITVFAEKGFARSTIKDVAQTAGIADGTIYIYFENKTALLLGILNRLNESDQREAQFEQAQEMDFETYFRSYLYQRITLMAGNTDVLQIILSEVLVNAELRQMYLQQVVEPTFVTGEKYFQQWIDNGTIKPLDLSLTLRAIASMALGLIMLRIMGDSQLQSKWDQLSDVVTEIVLYGIKIKRES